jgi:hypothetical protein
MTNCGTGRGWSSCLPAGRNGSPALVLHNRVQASLERLHESIHCAAARGTQCEPQHSIAHKPARVKRRSSSVQTAHQPMNVLSSTQSTFRSLKFVEKGANHPRAYEPGGFTADSPDPNMGFLARCGYVTSGCLSTSASPRPVGQG